MASHKDIAEATNILAEGQNKVMGWSGSKPEENRDGVADVVKKDENASSADAVVVTKRVIAETETVLEPTFGSNSDLVDMKKEENGVSSSLLGVEEIKKGDEVYCAENGGKNGKKCSQGYVDSNGKEQRTNDEKMEDLNSVFRVGDFVWGKIKSHPWWPGQVYDSKDASEFAVKYSQEGRILVAYFGDGSCSWCLPSQLVPFVENFKEMSTDSSSKNFLNAIQSAVNDIGRLVECNMTCKCVPLDKRGGLARPEVSNAGVKKGVLVPDVDLRRLSVPEYEPARIFEKLMNYAKAVSVDCLLELAVLRSWLSAFYCARGGYQLNVYCEPVYIEGLEDKNKTVNEVTDDFSVPIEVPILGPCEDDWLSSPAVKSHASSDDKIYHRRKQKSVAELMGENNRVNPKGRKRAKVREEKDVGKSALSQKKRKSGEITVDGVKKGNLSGKPKDFEVAVAENDSGEDKEELENVSSPRERKKSKYLSPPYTDPIWSMGISGAKMTSESDKATKLVNSSSDEELPIGSIKANDEKLTFTASDVGLQVGELLSEIQFAAVDPLYLTKKGSLDSVWAFVSALRSSTYLDGPDYKIYHKSKTGQKKKRKSLPSLKNQANGVPQEKTKSTDSKRTKKSGAKNSVEKSEGNDATCLILTFTPEFPLPSNEEIERLFGKFGSLDEKETNVFTDSHSVKIVYSKDSDAEAAFKSCITESPFGVENVNYWLQHSKSRPKITSRAFEKPMSSHSGDDFMSDVGAIREKLEIMSAILENYYSKFSNEEKTSLKDEMKNLMENVETTSEKVRVMAEKNTS